MRCKKSSGSIVTVTWKLFYPQCPKGVSKCNARAGAYVSAVTVCELGL